MLLKPAGLAQGPGCSLWPNGSFLAKGQAKVSLKAGLSPRDPSWALVSCPLPSRWPPVSRLSRDMFYRDLTFPEEENLVLKTWMRRFASLVRSSNTLAAVTVSSRMRNCSAPQSSGGLLRKRSKR